MSGNYMRIHPQSSQSKTDQQLTYKETHHRFQKQFKIKDQLYEIFVQSANISITPNKIVDKKFKIKDALICNFPIFAL